MFTSRYLESTTCSSTPVLNLMFSTLFSLPIFKLLVSSVLVSYSYFLHCSSSFCIIFAILQLSLLPLLYHTHTLDLYAGVHSSLFLPLRKTGYLELIEQILVVTAVARRWYDDSICENKSQILACNNAITVSLCQYDPIILTRSCHTKIKILLYPLCFIYSYGVASLPWVSPEKLYCGMFFFLFLANPPHWSGLGSGTELSWKTAQMAGSSKMKAMNLKCYVTVERCTDRGK